MNLKTFKKNSIYMGKMPERDYSFLDLSLLNLNKNVRKHIHSYLMSMDAQLKDYVKFKLGVADSSASFSAGGTGSGGGVGGLNNYLDLVGEKKLFMRTMIRARQLKRIVMIILTSQTIPLDTEEYTRMQTVFNEEVQWKINARWDD